MRFPFPLSPHANVSSIQCSWHTVGAASSVNLPCFQHLQHKCSRNSSGDFTLQSRTLKAHVGGENEINVLSNHAHSVSGEGIVPLLLSQCVVVSCMQAYRRYGKSNAGSALSEALVIPMLHCWPQRRSGAGVINQHLSWGTVAIDERCSVKR